MSGKRDIPCLACGVVGLEGRDVAFRVVEVPEYERRDVAVLLPVVADSGSLEMPVTVPERYVTEPRCRDDKACHSRVLAQIAENAPPAPPEPEPVPEMPVELPDEPAEEYVL